jgi:hypothetical protein
MEAIFQANEWDEYRDDGDHLATCVSLGDNFVVNVKEGNEEGVDFYVLLCTQTNFIVEQAFKCPWGQEFSIGDIIMVQKYYQSWGQSRCSYVLLTRSQTTYIHACNVKAIKFLMLLVDHMV